MCGLPTEEDEDVLQIAEMAKQVIRTGREASGRKDIRCTISIGGFVPKPHTPFQWAAQTDPETVDERLRKLCRAINSDRRIGRNIGVRYHDGKPSMIEGLLSRGDRRRGPVIERVWRAGGRFDGWNEHFCYESADQPGRVELPGAQPGFRARVTAPCRSGDDTVRSRPARYCPNRQHESVATLPLWKQASSGGPAGGPDDDHGREGILSRHDQPNSSAPPVQKVRLRYAKQGKLRFTSHRDVARAFERALRRAGVPMAHSQGFTPHPKVSWAGAVPTGVASESEYVEVQLTEGVVPELLQAEINAVLPAGMEIRDAVIAGPGSLADRLQASRWRTDVPGTAAAELRAAVQKLMAEESVLVERKTKDGRREIDARAALVSAEVFDGDRPVADGDRNPSSAARVDDWRTAAGPYGILVTVVRQTTPVVRPDDVLSALRAVAGVAPTAATSATRLEQGPLGDGGGVADPLAQDSGADRTPAGALAAR